MDRTILHVDFNAFYASVECFLHPELRDKAVIVCGDAERRCGIVLAKNEVAKKAGIATGDTIWQAERKLPGVVAVKAQFNQYLRFSHMARVLYRQYTDQVEPFGLDEAWLDVSSKGGEKEGERIAQQIRKRVTRELGLTVSIGVSFNKIFAKLGSDLKKPDAVSCITRENYQRLVWRLPAQDLLYVGSSTQKKLHKININTIGDIARAQPQFLQSYFGKVGLMLHSFANGLDDSPVKHSDHHTVIKSVGNSTTCPRDLENLDDVRIILYILSESVAARLRAYGLKGCVVGMWARNCQMSTYSKQCKLDHDTNLAKEIAMAALGLFENSYTWDLPVRGLGVNVTQLSVPGQEQLTLFQDASNQKEEALACSVEGIRQRFGNGAIMRCSVLQDEKFRQLNPQIDHVVHPISYF